MHDPQQALPQTRRHFMKTTAALGVAALTANAVEAGATPTLRVGLIGCGRRGAGAARDCVTSAEGVVIAAMGDLFPDKLAECREKLGQTPEKVTATDETCFTGFDAYQKVIACDVDMVIIATPPGFRPLQLRAAIEAGKHVFMEKPAAVDPAGVRSIIESSELAANKGLSIVAGTQRRHQRCYQETIKRIHEGAIGDIVSAECYWVDDFGYYPAVLREADWSDMEWQIRNWNYFTWLSGDHIVEQHVHNIDVINWVLRAHPVKAFGMGGRQQRTGPEFGHIYDHFAVEFEYPGGIRVTSMCRQNASTYSRVDEFIVGSKGTSRPREEITGPNAFRFQGEAPNPYVQEHADLIGCIRTGVPINEGRAVAESTMAAIMGRMAAYTGQEVTWDWAMNESKLNLWPETLEFGPMPTPPVAVPGYTQLI
ncbi:MAG: Gfo/Idh/MocA family oxidoreductase [Candidatus Hydrogenedentes bacterium]|nr:Gfo/Idh/MocA family oxidoreductase [Candidatus Hydrogenedentota bacterium]